jgi:hypothetical protein
VAEPIGRRTIDLNARRTAAPIRRRTIDLAAPPRRLDPEGLRDTSVEDEGSDAWTVAQAMLAETVKIGGVRFENGEWSWDPSNIGRYFEEEPVWATIDAITLAAPALKWGKAAYTVSKGITAPGLAYKAGKLGLREAASIQARNAVPTTAVGRFLSNPAARGRFDDDYMKLIGEVGATTEYEKKAVADVLRREFVAESGYWRSRTAEMIGALQKAGIPESEHETFVRLMEGAFDPSQEKTRKWVEKLLEPDAVKAFEETWRFREELGWKAHDLKMLSAERIAEQKTWMPHMQSLQYRKTLESKGFKFGSEDVFEQASWDNFRHRKYSREEFEALFDRDFDPKHAAVRMGAAAQAVARESYLTGLIDSALVKDSSKLVDHLLDPNGPLANDKVAKLWGLSPDLRKAIVEGLKAAPRNTDGSFVDEALAPILDAAGWVRMGDAAPGLKMPPKYADLFVDKKVVDDLAGIVKLMDPKGENAFGRIYDDAMAGFRAAKTAYNPATHVRNIFGAFVFTSLATGMRGALDPRTWQKAWKVWNEGMKNPLFHKMAEAGVTGATFDAELRSAWREVFGETIFNKATALDFLGDSRVAKLAQKVGGGMERFYRSIDEVARVAAWTHQYDRFRRLNKAKWAGKELEERAANFATLEVAKFTPSFNMHSPFSNLLRRHIPFASFSHEAVRVWKNAMVEKPHLAFFWSHFADSAGQAFGAMAGFTPEQIETAKQNLPYYQDGKKMLMWPFRVDGKPVFVDMSYLIPMANIVEVEREQSSFLGTAAGLAGLNPTTNPFVNLLYAGTTGQDAFRQRPIEPNITERQLGIPVEGTKTRTAVGLVEHVANTFLPPLVPPGYAGINIVEWMRSQNHPTTGQPLEDGMWRTIGSNVLGVRLHEADVNAAMLNVGHEDRRMNERIADWWLRWQWATANGDVKLAERAEANLRELQIQRGKTPEEADDYVADGVEKRAPGMYRNYPKSQVERALQDAAKLELGTAAGDAQQMANMAAVTRQKRRRSRKRTRRTRARSRE